MKIPETIQIAGIEYSIQTVNSDHPKLDHGVYNGAQVNQTSEIILNENLKGDKKLQTFTHEIVHAICDALSVSNQDIIIDERFVESFSQILLQIIKQLTK